MVTPKALCRGWTSSFPTMPPPIATAAGFGSSGRRIPISSRLPADEEGLVASAVGVGLADSSRRLHVLAVPFLRRSIDDDGEAVDVVESRTKEANSIAPDVPS